MMKGIPATIPIYRRARCESEHDPHPEMSDVWNQALAERLVSEMRATHTYVVLEVSSAVYEEIAGKLRAAAYDQAFIEDGSETVIDMHGIALQCEAEPEMVTRDEITPTRVLVDRDGRALSVVHAAAVGVVPEYIFVRKDGWSLGAPRELREEARRLWQGDWIEEWHRLLDRRWFRWWSQP